MTLPAVARTLRALRAGARAFAAELRTAPAPTAAEALSLSERLARIRTVGADVQANAIVTSAGDPEWTDVMEQIEREKGALKKPALSSLPLADSDLATDFTADQCNELVAKLRRLIREPTAENPSADWDDVFEQLRREDLALRRPTRSLWFRFIRCLYALATFFRRAHVANGAHADIAASSFPSGVDPQDSGDRR